MLPECVRTFACVAKFQPGCLYVCVRAFLFCALNFLFNRLCCWICCWSGCLFAPCVHMKWYTRPTSCARVYVKHQWTCSILIKRARTFAVYSVAGGLWRISHNLFVYAGIYFVCMVKPTSTCEFPSKGDLFFNLFYVRVRLRYQRRVKG